MKILAFSTLECVIGCFTLTIGLIVFLNPSAELKIGVNRIGFLKFHDINCFRNAIFVESILKDLEVISKLIIAPSIPLYF